jgi:cytochrome c oxidase assembly protein subunit 15
MDNLSPRWKNFLDNKITIQFIHRGLAYAILIVVLFWWAKSGKAQGTPFFKKVRSWPLILVLLQVALGIATVTLSPFGNNLLWFGVAHQMVAMLFLMSFILMLYIIRPSEKQKRYF